MNERRLGPVGIWFFVVIAAVLIYFLTTWFGPVREARDHGEPIPITEPNEANRRFHENGMSIIVPPGWRRARWHTQLDENTLIYVSGSSFPSFLEVELVDESFNASGHQIPWNFNGTMVRAYQRETELGGRLERRLFEFEIVVHIDGQRFRIAYRSQEKIHELPQSVVGYINSFLPPVTNDLIELLSASTVDVRCRWGGQTREFRPQRWRELLNSSGRRSSAFWCGSRLGLSWPIE